MELTGTFFHYDEMNRNGRIYSEEVVDDMVVQFNNLDHPMYGELNPGYDNEIYMGIHNPSHEVRDLRHNRETKSLEGTIQLLDTHSGKIAQELLKAEIPLSVASRSIGSVDGSGYATLQKLITYDLVHDVSFVSDLKMVDATTGDTINIIIDDKHMSVKSVNYLSEIKDEELYEGLLSYVFAVDKKYVYSQGMWCEVKDDTSTGITLNQI